RGSFPWNAATSGASLDHRSRPRARCARENRITGDLYCVLPQRRRCPRIEPPTVAAEGCRLSRPTRSLSVLWAPLLFSAIFAAQCLWFVGTQSLTYDEPTHVIAGLDAWRHHRFDQWNDQPPLA